MRLNSERNTSVRPGWRVLAGEPRCLIAAAVAVVGLATTPAAAALVDFSFTGPGLDVAGQLVTTGVPNGYFGEDVTGMTGSVNGAPFTFIADPTAPLPFTTPDGAFNYDDDFSVTAPYLDAAGLLFDVGNTEYNLYRFNGIYSILSYTAGNTVYNPQVNGILAVPEPAVWSMLLTGLAAIGVGLRGRGRAAARAG